MDYDKMNDLINVICNTVLVIFAIAGGIWFIMDLDTEMAETVEHDNEIQLRDEMIYNYYDNKDMVVDDVIERKNGTLLVNFKSGDYKVVEIEDGKIEEVVGGN